MKTNVIDFVRYKKNKERKQQIDQYETVMNLLCYGSQSRLIDADDIADIMEGIDQLPPYKD